MATLEAQSLILQGKSDHGAVWGEKGEIVGAK